MASDAQRRLLAIISADVVGNSRLMAEDEEATVRTLGELRGEVARRQSEKSYELRAATSLARLWQRQGRVEDGRELLAPVYSW